MAADSAQGEEEEEEREDCDRSVDVVQTQHYCIDMERTVRDRGYSSSPLRRPDNTWSYSPSSRPRLSTISPVPSSRYIPGVYVVYRVYGRGYKTVGLGIALCSGVMLTARAVIHTPSTASRSYVLHVATQEWLELRPNALFATLLEGNMTVVGVERSGADVVKVVQRFVLERNQEVRVPALGNQVGRVKMVEKSRFFFHSSSALLAGTPVFTPELHFQGLTVSPSTTYGYNEAFKVDCFLSLFLQKAHLMYHIPGLKSLLSEIYFAPKREKREEEEERILWFEWLSGVVRCYDAFTGKWSAVGPREGQEEYLWGCKSVELPDGSYLLIGGLKDDRPSTQVLCFSPVLNKVTVVASLLTPRIACGVTYCIGKVYAIGGEHTSGSCETYPLKDMTWVEIRPLQLERAAINAVAAGKGVYVVGGLPLREVGRSVERYVREDWELMQVRLPEQVCNSGLAAVDEETLAIIGGRHSKRVHLLKLTPSPSLQECPSLSLPLETQYSVHNSQHTGLLYLFNAQESLHLPSVTTYYKADLYLPLTPSPKPRIMTNFGIR